MAVRRKCFKCDKEYVTNSNGEWECEDCNGTTAVRQKEEERWDALPIEEKIEELRKRIEYFENINRRLA